MQARARFQSYETTSVLLSTRKQTLNFTGARRLVSHVTRALGAQGGTGHGALTDSAAIFDSHFEFPLNFSQNKQLGPFKVQIQSSAITS